MFFVDELKDLKMYKKKFLYPINDSNKKLNSAVVLLTPNLDSSIRVINHELANNRFVRSYYVEKSILYVIQQENGLPVLKKEDDVVLEALRDITIEKKDVVYSGYPMDIEDVAPVINQDTVKKFCSKYKLKGVKYPINVNIYRKTICPPSGGNNINVSTKYEYGHRIYKNYTAYLRYEMIEYLLKENLGNKNVQFRDKMIAGVALYESGLYDIHKNKWVFDPRLKTLCQYIERYIDRHGEEHFIKTFKSDYYKPFILEGADIDGIWEEDLSTVVIPHKYNEPINTSTIIGTRESVKISDNLVFILNEDAAFNTQLKKSLYNDRLKSNKDLAVIYDKVKAECKDIKLTFYSIDRYKDQNLFFDTSHYNDVFIRNNTFKGKKGNGVYLELMKRLINSKSLESYTKKTVVIPVSDWNRNPDTKIYDYMKNINPLSALYLEMYMNPNAFKEAFGDTEFLFLGDKSYFKVNFNKMELNKSKLAIICRNLELLKVKGFVTNEDDDEPESSPKAITADIVDKIEKSQDVTIDNIEVKENPKDEKEAIVAKVSKTAELNKSTNDTLEVLDDDENLKKLLVTLSTDSESGPKISDARVARNMELDKQLMDKEVKGKKVSEILNDSNKKKELEKVKLDVDSVNEEWKELTYPSALDKYEPDEDIIKVFRSFSNTSHPLAIRSIKVENTSTSEDKIETYTVEYENENGKRFTIKVDVPIMIDHKYMKLRGNRKNINGQLTLVPIIKTDEDTVQVVSYSYKKIFIRRFGTTTGKSNVTCDRLIKTLNKNQFKDITITEGDCGKVCSKYEVPIDYLDLSTIYSKIVTPQYTIFFNQDEFRNKYTVDDKKGLPIAIKNNSKEIIYYKGESDGNLAIVVKNMLAEADSEFLSKYDSTSKSVRYTYSQASILGQKIPLVILCAYSEGLQKTLKKANIEYDLIPLDAGKPKYNPDYYDIIKFNDGWIKYKLTYASSLLMNGLKACNTDTHSLTEINSKPLYLDFFDLFGSRIMADGLDNFYDVFLDPITLEVLEDYKLPTDYIEVLLYANTLLADNKYVKHTQINGRRIRRNELIPGYLYTAMSESYQDYTRSMKHGRQVPMTIKQSAVIDKILADNTVSDLSVLTPLGEYEAVNTVSPKGLSGLNSDRSYTLDKRTFDDSMVNVFGMSTGFAGNVGINRQATIDMNVSGKRGYIRSLEETPTELSPTKSFCMTEALTPYGCTRDDPFRTAMTFIQTSKHLMRSNNSDPSLITSGADEALPYLISNTFVHKAKGKGEVIEKSDYHMIISYDDDTTEYVDLRENVEKNSSSGFFVTLKLDSDLKVGSKVKEGQIIAYDKSSFNNEIGAENNLAYNIGKLKKCAILNTDEGYEDSAIISQELANDLTHSVVLKVDKIFSKDTNIYNLVKVGQEIEEGDNLLIIQASYDEDDTNTLLKKLSDVSEDDITDLGRQPIKSKVTGVIQDIVMYRTVELDELSDSLRKAFVEYEKNIETRKKIMKKYGIDSSSLPANYKLPPTGKLKNAENGVLIEFYLRYEDMMSVGDKLIYYSALKGVIRDIFPEGKEPTSSFRPDEKIHSLLAVGSVNGRMVTSVLINGCINKYLIELSRKCKEIAGMKVSVDDI